LRQIKENIGLFSITHPSEGFRSYLFRIIDLNGFLVNTGSLSGTCGAYPTLKMCKPANLNVSNLSISQALQNEYSQSTTHCIGRNKVFEISTVLVSTQKWDSELSN
jgi:hypothetical protein